MRLHTRRPLPAFTVIFAAAGPAALARAEEPHHRAQMANPPLAPQPGPQPSAARTFWRYQIPAVTLVNQDGQSVSLETILSGGKPVALNFIYTTCRTICPVMRRPNSPLSRSMTFVVRIVFHCCFGNP